MLNSIAHTVPLQFNPTFILSGTQRGIHATGGSLAYAQYLRYISRKAGPLDPVDQYAQGYMDHLQAPLQPLMDNLEGETYEGFEKDPIKYRQYEEAVFQALSDRSDRVPMSVQICLSGSEVILTSCTYPEIFSSLELDEDHWLLDVLELPSVLDDRLTSLLSRRIPVLLSCKAPSPFASRTSC